jgi:hypothetical protein
VTIVLRNRTRIGLAFSPEFPRDHAVVDVVPPGKHPAGSAEVSLPGVTYKVNAPGLLAAVWDLFEDQASAGALETQFDWLPH